MYIRLDVFAGLLRIRPGELLHAVRNSGTLDGMPLPARHQVRGAAVMFDHAEASEFARRWHAREPVAAPPASGENLIPLDDFARRAGIPPLVLWQAASGGKRLRGLSVPVALKEGGQLKFEPSAVEKFVTSYHNLQAKK
ncbi:hypothetical protein LA637_p2078 (plasmid) [Erwinia amylovora LA637]|uniref:hypothetical protein n=1 Tax=Erwinia amylovora TaxID=552 RepID=UPI0003D682D2|nr:hypothetical protein [Erwinia amylovora]CDK23950.1 hypothetical protein LA637_p2078 [Erwinia amylovora LA637]